MSHTLHWKHTDEGLELLNSQHSTTVPDPIAEILLRDTGSGLGVAPENDLLTAEGQLRQEALARESRIADAEAELHVTRGRLRELDVETSGRRWVPRAHRRERTALARLLTQQITENNTAVNELRECRIAIDAIREFVIDLDPAAGLLAEAATGWQREPVTPASVIVFASESDFIDADLRRAIRGGWGGPILDAEIFGTRWRRDGDDTDPQAPPASRSGPWQVGYLTSLGEVYALRRCTHLPEQLWLLGSGLDDPGATRGQLAALSRRMAEPNSLILAADTVHALANGVAAGTALGGGR